jgi:hypothetical protein
VVLWLIEVERVGGRRGWLHIRLPGVSGCTVTYSSPQRYLAAEMLGYGVCYVWVALGLV